MFDHIAISYINFLYAPQKTNKKTQLPTTDRMTQPHLLTTGILAAILPGYEIGDHLLLKVLCKLMLTNKQLLFLSKMLANCIK